MNLNNFACERQFENAVISRNEKEYAALHSNKESMWNYWYGFFFRFHFSMVEICLIILLAISELFSPNRARYVFRKWKLFTAHNLGINEFGCSCSFSCYTCKKIHLIRLLLSGPKCYFRSGFTIYILKQVYKWITRSYLLFVFFFFPHSQQYFTSFFPFEKKRRWISFESWHCRIIIYDVAIRKSHKT